jgi:hypothetical protein
VNLCPVPDLGVFDIAMFLGVVYSPFLFLGVVAIEAVVLQRMMPEGRAIRDSFVMNFITVLLGFIGLTPRILETLTGVHSPQWAFYYADSRMPTYLLIALLISWVLSVSIEAGVLVWLQSQYPARRAWWVSLVANSISYAGLICVVLVYSFPGR